MTIATTNPTTGETVRIFEADDAPTVDRKIGEAEAAYQILKSSTFAQRGEWMRAAAQFIEDEAETTARTLVLEMGKPLVQARAEVLKCAKNLRFYADHAEGFLQDDRLSDPSVVGAAQAYAAYRPLGVVLAVMPWNYAFWQVIRFAAPALMAGNTGLLKHSSNVPQAALYLDSIFERGGFPAGSFRALLIGSGDVKNVIEDPRVKAVTLTGSELAGRSVAAIAGEQIKKSVMELGGSDPFIVMPSADLESAAETAVKARVQNNGQSCVAAKRFLVHTQVYEEFSRLFTDKMGALVVGDPMDERTDVGPLATEAGRTDLSELVEDAKSKGARVLVGGNAVEGPGWFYQPTLLSGITEEMRIVQEETFGPVASLYEVVDQDEAIRIANQTAFGLSSSVWTNDTDEEASFVRELDAGAVFINGMTVSYPELPFGGVKDSGFGRELAAEGIREFCNIKTVWKA